MSHEDAPIPFLSSRSGKLKGAAAIPGDKSISHRALMFGGLAKGRTIIHGLLEGEDVLNTAAAMRAMGARITRNEDGTWMAEGGGIGNLTAPEEALEMGNSGTSTRLLAGLVAGHPVRAAFTGDASLSSRPMKRIMLPLGEMGAVFTATDGDKLPMTIEGAANPSPINYRLPVASAQVKSAILLAGLRAGGTTTVIETKPTRDHTENMLRHFGMRVEIEDLENGAEAVHLEGGQDMVAGADIHVPSDPSSAAFPAVAAAICEGSNLFLPRIGMNPRRNGIFLCLAEMGADIAFENERIEAGEPVADIRIRGTKTLRGITVPQERVPSMIDEFPILFIAASFAEGTTIAAGLEELRVKESDRLAMMAKGLEQCGVRLETGADSLTIHGTGKPPRGGGTIETALDHRIAMSFLIMGLASENPVTIDDVRPINTSFPGFAALINRLAGKDALHAA
ncbi:MAG: 3-phosphoshikimate 1-carboxyvinyltransferase [Micavibrio sp.]